MAIAALLALAAQNCWSQATGGDPVVRTVFVAARAGQADAVRRRVLERLRRAEGVHVVPDEGSADAVLQIETTIWPTGAVSLNPRSGTVDVRNAAGYASAELVAGARKDRQQQQRSNTVWSYLATPGRFRLGSLTDDLGDQLTAALLAALRTGVRLTPEIGADPASQAVAGAPLRVSGATFPAPLYARWFESFRAQGGAGITYDPVGSVAGMRALSEGKADMAASDIPAEPGASETAIHLPAVLGGVVPVYNLPGLGGVLNLTPAVLARIFSGEITQWSDPRLQAGNKGLRLPHAPIAVFHRSEGSGTTFVWTSFLASAGTAWPYGAAAEIAWPVGTGVTGSEGMATAVRQTPNAIGYVEMTFAIQYQLAYGAIQNPARRFVRATLASLALAAQSGDLTGSRAGGLLLNRPGEGTYPVASFTSFVLPPSSALEGDAQRRRTLLLDFLRWMLVAGQKQCSSLGYAPLPKEMVAAELKVLDGLH